MKQLLAVLFLATPALAQQRITTMDYSADRIYPVAGHRGIQTMIEFGGDERIENIALGDSAAWQITPNKRANLVFLKPLMAKARTNMTVVTDKRRYLFDLYNGGPHGRPVYVLRFIYPEAFKALPDPVAVAPPPPPPTLNEHWQVTGDVQLTPARIYDDGVSTFIAWNTSTELPAVLTIGTDGSEGPVNYTVKGDYIVVDGIAARYVLRIGKARAVLTNLAPRPPKPLVGPEGHP
jgi:type IV secretion system protein VirB9